MNTEKFIKFYNESIGYNGTVSIYFKSTDAGWIHAIKDLLKKKIQKMFSLTEENFSNVQINSFDTYVDRFLKTNKYLVFKKVDVDASKSCYQNLKNYIAKISSNAIELNEKNQELAALRNAIDKFKTDEKATSSTVFETLLKWLTGEVPAHHEADENANFKLKKCQAGKRSQGS